MRRASRPERVCSSWQRLLRHPRPGLVAVTVVLCVRSVTWAAAPADPEIRRLMELARKPVPPLIIDKGRMDAEHDVLRRVPTQERLKELARNGWVAKNETSASRKTLSSPRYEMYELRVGDVELSLEIEIHSILRTVDAVTVRAWLPKSAFEPGQKPIQQHIDKILAPVVRATLVLTPEVAPVLPRVLSTARTRPPATRPGFRELTESEVCAHFLTGDLWYARVDRIDRTTSFRDGKGLFLFLFFRGPLSVYGAGRDGKGESEHMQLQHTGYNMVSHGDGSATVNWLAVVRNKSRLERSLFAVWEFKDSSGKTIATDHGSKTIAAGGDDKIWGSLRLEQSVASKLADSDVCIKMRRPLPSPPIPGSAEE